MDYLTYFAKNCEELFTLDFFDLFSNDYVCFCICAVLNCKVNKLAVSRGTKGKLFNDFFFSFGATYIYFENSACIRERCIGSVNAHGWLSVYLGIS